MRGPEKGLALEGEPGETRVKVKVRVVELTLYSGYLVASDEYLVRED